MEIEDHLFLEDDQDILDIINFGFPRRHYERTEHFDTMDNMSFFRRFRLTKPTVLNFLELIEEELEYDNDLNNSITPMNQFLTALRIYSCAGHQTSVGDFIGAHQATVSRILKRVTNAIARLRPHYIAMPNNDHERLRVATDFYNIARFPKIIGCVDGTHIKIQSPGGEDPEVFRNRKAYFSINTQVVGDASLNVRDIVARWPGSTHDQTIFINSRLRARFENLEFPDSVLLGDSGYANRNYLLVLLQNPRTESELLYNESHIRTRNTIERLFGVLKRRFPILAYGLRYTPEFGSNIIVATAILHNCAYQNNEAMPPPPEEIDEAQLNYLVEIGNIDAEHPHEENQAGNQIHILDYRMHLINNYFSNL